MQVRHEDEKRCVDCRHVVSEPLRQVDVGDGSLPGPVALGQSPLENFGSLHDVGIGLDIDDTGVSFDVFGSWPPEPPAAQIAAPPARP